MSTSAPRRILIVDDEEETANALRRVLEQRGYEVAAEHDSRQALTKARALQPEVVILDYRMPGLHGGDVAWQLASDPILRSVKVILCTGASAQEFAHRLPPARIPILEKPVEVERLLALLQS
jgi:CheY-like chemotaxis protein